MEGRLSYRQLKRASFFYKAGLQRYWARTHDMPTMTRYLNYWATAVPTALGRSRGFSRCQRLPGDEQRQDLTIFQGCTCTQKRGYPIHKMKPTFQLETRHPYNYQHLTVLPPIKHVYVYTVCGSLIPYFASLNYYTVLSRNFADPCTGANVLSRMNSLWAVSSLVVRASDSRPEGLGSMPVPPNTLQVHTEYVLVKSVGYKVLWAESRVQGTGENFPPLQFHA
ncbi:uncharacterized protein TNCV_2623481 [Trichonephila clavipes]|nr:uncharacterized protein TNCV_2623481 [Trichonephila clavipes]